MPRRQRIKFHRLSAGVEEFLKTNPGVQGLINSKTAAVQAAAEAQDPQQHAHSAPPLVVKSTTGLSQWPGHADRYAGTVTLAHPAGIPIEAKYGVLKNATAAAGMGWGRRSHT